MQPPQENPPDNELPLPPLPDLPKPTDESVPVPPDQQPVYPIQDPPAPHEKAPIDEGPKGPKLIV